MKTVVFSFYMQNITSDIVFFHQMVVRKFLPSDFHFYQILTRDSHGDSIDGFVSRDAFDVYILLDIDAIPLNHRILAQLQAEAVQGGLVGCAQRSKKGGTQLYAAPCGMAFTKALYHRLGRPSFASNPRGDVGQEWTHRCEESGIPVRLLLPTDVVQPTDLLRDDLHYGPGTTYEEALYHAFEIRAGINRRRFVNKCTTVL